MKVKVLKFAKKFSAIIVLIFAISSMFTQQVQGQCTYYDAGVFINSTPGQNPATFTNQTLPSGACGTCTWEYMWIVRENIWSGDNVYYSPWSSSPNFTYTFPNSGDYSVQRCCRYVGCTTIIENANVYTIPVPSCYTNNLVQNYNFTNGWAWWSQLTVSGTGPTGIDAGIDLEHNIAVVNYTDVPGEYYLYQNITASPNKEYTLNARVGTHAPNGYPNSTIFYEYLNSAGTSLGVSASYAVTNDFWAVGLINMPPLVATTPANTATIRIVCKSLGRALKIAHVTLNEKLTITPPTVTKVNPTCSVTTGSFTITAVAGYTYSVDGGAYAATPLTFSGLVAGSTHTVVAKTASGCLSAATSVTIGPLVQTSVGGIVSPALQTLCFPNTTISTLHTLSGYIGNIVRWEYKPPGGSWTNWGGGGVTSAPSTCCFVTVGTWQVRAIIQNGICAEVASSIADVVVYDQPVAPTGTQVNPTSSVTTGSFTITAVAGYTYSVDGGAYAATPLTFSGLVAGSTHTVVAKNSTGCTSAITYVTIGAAANCASLGDYVWNDLNGNGLQDSGEPGVQYVVVNLLNSAGTVISTTTTSATGAYSFTNLAPGTYGVSFVTPAGAVATTSNVGADDTKDSDPVAGTVTGIVLTAGQNNTTIDAGFYIPANLGNLVFWDLNNNGIFDGTDYGASGIPVKLYLDANNDNIPDGGSIATMNTTSAGNYSFLNLVPSTYLVEITVPSPGHKITATNGGDPDNNINNDNNGITTAGITRSLPITLNGAEPTTDGDGANGNLTLDFGIIKTSALGDFVWVDTNGNGVQESGEPGLAGVTVTLKNSLGTVVGTTSTSATGIYSFIDLIPGSYTVTFSTPAGYIATPSNASGNDTNDSDPVSGVVSVTLPYNTTDNSIDAGFYLPAAIGNFVWNDQNGNGIQDTGEPGIQWVTVNLLNSAGTVIATTTTDVNGAYSFTNIAPGTYSVSFVTPVGAVPASSNLGGNDATDSDPVAGLVTGIVLTSGQTNNTIDAGYYLTVNVGNFVWHDKNINGIQDAGEPGVAGIVVNLYTDNNTDNLVDGALIATATTDANGLYNFANLTPGNYIVGVVLPAAYTAGAFTATSNNPNNDNNTDNNGINPVSGELRSNFVTLISGSEPTNDGDGNTGNLSVDFALKGTSSIGNYVWNDVNANGIQDATEVGIAGATVNLLNAAGTVINTTTTNASGAYSFTNLAPGTYGVSFVTPATYTPTGSNLGGNDATDSDPVSGTVTGIVLTAGQTNNTIDAGFYIPAAIGNYVWNDANANGVQDATEVGIAGVSVSLYTTGADGLYNTADDIYQTGTTTDINGYYSFTNLKPGNYHIWAGKLGIDPTSTVWAYTTSINAGDNQDNTNSDGQIYVNAMNQWSNSLNINLIAGETDNTIDFGMYKVSSIGNYVWNDVNANGVQDATEVGIAGATVNLLNAAGTVINTTTTNASGAYSFTNLAPGTYGVSFSTPATYTPTGSNLGGNDATDSDPVSGTVTGIVLTAGQTNNTIDAGFYIPAALGNYVWNDVNANGVQDATEVGIAGVNMSLTTSGPDGVFNTVDDVFQAGVPTDANGYYAFTNLKPGDYRVWANKLAIDASSSIWAYTTSINAGDNQNNTNSDGQIHINLMNEWSNSLTINLIAGETDNTIDFGMYKVSSIGNYVWNDVNANGVQDATEVGIAGATVNLLNATGTVINTTTTNASGAYSFTNLAPGTYGVGFVTPTGYSNASPANLGGNDATDSDPVSGTVTGIILTSGQTDNTIDAGFYNCLPITSGINGPLTICAAESALFTATGAGSGSVYTWAFMSGTPATATGSSVTSSWSTPGEYDINLTVTKNGCTASYLKSIIITQSVFAGAGPDAAICSGGNTTLTGSGPAGSTYSWTVVSGDPTSIDNGASQASALVSPLSTTTYMLTVTQNGCTRTDQVIVNIDVNKNPTANAGPNKTTLLGTPVVIGGSPTGTPPLASPGATLGYIWSAATGLNSTSIANPSATLTAVGTVNYQVIVYSTLTGCSDTSVVAVTALQPVNVGNYVWYDKNDNGIKEVGEPAVNTTVNLYKDDNNDNIADGAAIATMATVNGVYNFGNLYPGNYIVGAIIPTGYAVVTTNGGDPDNNTDNDNNGTNTSVLGEVRSSAVTLLGGSEPIVGADGDDNNGNLTVDFGFKGTAALGNFVWYDSNRDGVQDAAEIGIPNAIVTLTYPDGGTVTTNTNSLGAYSFTNLAPGTTYSVAFTTPTGYTPTVSNSVIAGATDANDSDPIGGVVSSISLVANQVNNTIDAGFHNSCSSLISGNIWHDTSAMANNMVDSIGSYAVVAIPNALRVYLVSNASGKVIKSALVSGNGVFNFANVLPGSYYILLSTIGSSVGADAPSTRLPTGWRNTGEKLGLGTGRDLQVNGILNVSIGYECVNNANFGIKFRNKGIGID